MPRQVISDNVDSHTVDDGTRWDMTRLQEEDPVGTPIDHIAGITIRGRHGARSEEEYTASRDFFKAMMQILQGDDYEYTAADAAHWIGVYRKLHLPEGTLTDPAIGHPAGQKPIIDPTFEAMKSSVHHEAVEFHAIHELLQETPRPEILNNQRLRLGLSRCTSLQEARTAAGEQWEALEVLLLPHLETAARLFKTPGGHDAIIRDYQQTR
jgi:hypothetical protein